MLAPCSQPQLVANLSPLDPLLTTSSAAQATVMSLNKSSAKIRFTNGLLLCRASIIKESASMAKSTLNSTANQEVHDAVKHCIAP